MSELLPKDKANQLIYFYENLLQQCKAKERAVKCALIAVDEMLAETEKHLKLAYFIEKQGAIESVKQRLEYWHKVKQEIEQQCTTSIQS